MRKLILIPAFMFLLAGMLLLSVHICALDHELYFSIQERIGLIKEDDGDGNEAVRALNREITDYLSGKSDKMMGVSVKAFMHMEDVRALLLKAEYVSYAVMFLSAVLFLFSGRQRFSLRAGAFAAFPALVCALIPVFKKIDFHGLFIRFHEFAFDNDYWILDPLEDMLIRILPEEFFSMMAFEIIRRGLLLYLAAGAGAVLLSAVFYGRRKHELL